jgi:hypothetical protein
VAITSALTPQFPPPGREVALQLTASVGNFIRLWIVDAPEGSSLRADLDGADEDESRPASRLEVFAERTGQVHRFIPDVGGAYVFEAQEITKGLSTGGGFVNAPTAQQTEVLVGGVATVTVYIGQRTTQRVGISSPQLLGTATLALWTFNVTIRATTLAAHGEETPALINPEGTLGRGAALDSAVVTALGAIADTTAASFVGTASAVASDLITKFNAHRTQATVHNANDTDNAINTAFVSSGVSEVGLIQTVNDIRLRFTRHQQNDNAGAGVDTANYHDDKLDFTHRVLAPVAGDLTSAIVLLADLARAFEAHRVQVSSPDLHDVSDTTNVLAARPAHIDLHEKFSAALAIATAAATDNAGTVTLIGSGGFVLETL